MECVFFSVSNVILSCLNRCEHTRVKIRKCYITSEELFVNMAIFLCLGGFLKFQLGYLPLIEDDGRFAYLDGLVGFGLASRRLTRTILQGV